MTYIFYQYIYIITVIPVSVHVWIWKHVTEHNAETFDINIRCNCNLEKQEKILCTKFSK